MGDVVKRFLKCRQSMHKSFPGGMIMNVKERRVMLCGYLLKKEKPT